VEKGGFGGDESKGLESELKTEIERDWSVLATFGSANEGEDVVESPADPESRSDPDVEVEAFEEDVEINGREDASEL